MIIGLVGKAGAGKSEVAGHLVREHGYVELAFAKRLKEVCQSVTGWHSDFFYDPEEKEVPLRFTYHRYSPKDLSWGISDLLGLSLVDVMTRIRTVFKSYYLAGEITPRQFLQLVGTDVCRAVEPDVWVRQWREQAFEMGLPVSARNYAIPDVRFKNEIDFIRHAKLNGGGIIVRVERDGAGSTSGAEHVSEHEWQQAEPDVIIYNQGPIENLHNTINQMMERSAWAKQS
jgi:hypothetical protein